jgi:hypothetical protein
MTRRTALAAQTSRGDFLNSSYSDPLKSLVRRGLSNAKSDQDLVGGASSFPWATP